MEKSDNECNMQHVELNCGKLYSVTDSCVDGTSSP